MTPDERIAAWEKAYERYHGQAPATPMTYGSGYYRHAGGMSAAYRAADVDRMTANLSSAADRKEETDRRFSRVVRELGPGWRYEPKWQGAGTYEPAAVRDYVAITANGRGYQARFSDGVTTQTETGPSPLQALGSCLHAVDLAVKRLQRHLEEARR